MSKNNPDHPQVPNNTGLGKDTKSITNNLSWWQELCCCYGKTEKVFDLESMIAGNDNRLAELFNSKSIIVGEANILIMKARIFSFFDSQPLHQISKNLAINFANKKIDEIEIEVMARIDPSHRSIIVFGCSDSPVTIDEMREAIKLAAEEADNSFMKDRGNALDKLDIYFFAYTSELANIQAMDNALILAGLVEDFQGTYV